GDTVTPHVPCGAPWQRLYFLPEPHGHGAFRDGPPALTDWPGAGIFAPAFIADCGPTIRAPPCGPAGRPPLGAFPAGALPFGAPPGALPAGAFPLGALPGEGRPPPIPRAGACSITARPAPASPSISGEE